MKVHDAGLSPFAKSSGLTYLLFTVTVVFMDKTEKKFSVIAEAAVHAKLHVWYSILKPKDHNNVSHIEWSIDSTDPMLLEQANYIPQIGCLCGRNDECDH